MNLLEISDSSLSLQISCVFSHICGSLLLFSLIHLRLSCNEDQSATVISGNIPLGSFFRSEISLFI